MSKKIESSFFSPPFPSNWSRKSLYTLATWTNGLAFRDFHFSANGKPVIKIAELKNGLTDQTQYTQQTFDGVYYLRQGDMLFAWSGSPETSIDVFWYRGVDAWLNQHIFKVEPSAECNPIFFFQLLKYLKPLFIEIAKNKQTTGLGHVTSGDLKSITVGVPPLPIQRRIASILGALDDKIECNRRINQTLEQMAQALYKHWFVDFAPFRGEGMVESELGEIPRGWRVGKFGDIAVNPRVGADPRKLASDTPYIGLEHMPRQTIALDDWGSSSQVTSNKWAFQRKQILFGKLRPYFHKVGIAPIDGVCSSDILVIEPSQRAYFGMTLCVVSNAEFVNYTSAASGGTRMPRTSWEQMTRYPVAIPTEEIAARFNQQIDLWAEQIITNIIENRSLARTRDYLLPKLMSGEIEIMDAEKVRESD